MAIQRSGERKQTLLNFLTSQTKCKHSSLNETKDFWKDNLKQVVLVLQSLRGI